MEVTWSDRTFEFLRAWLDLEGWHVRNAVTDRHFLIFMASVWADEHKIWDEQRACEVIGNLARELHPDLADTTITETLRDRRCPQGSLILDFLATVDEEEQFHLLTLSQA